MNESALSGLRVIDLSRILAGPYCTMMLADYGAEVIKVERPGLGDGSRAWGPPWVGEQSAYFLSVNRNKKSMTLNLKRAEGREILKKLVQGGDVLVENFKAGTMEKLGLDYETLAAINPGLVYCAITGYGQNGPYRDRPGYDFIIQAQGGIMSITGPAEGGPHKVGVAIVDVTAGLFAATAILAALQERERSGQGQYIDVALLDAQLGWLVNVAQNYFVTGDRPGRYGNAHPNIVPYETFPTADGYIAIGVGSDGQFRRLCDVIGRPDLWEEERFQTNDGRVRHRETLVPILETSLRTRTTEAWMARLLKAEVPAGPINDVPAVMTDPQVAARGMVQEVESAEGRIRQVGPVAKLSRTPAEVRSAPPLLGADTEEVLRELDYSPAEIERMREAGAV